MTKPGTLVSQTCVNCRHRHTSASERRCVTCIAGPPNEFPMWESEEEQQQPAPGP